MDLTRICYLQSIKSTVRITNVNVLLCESVKEWCVYSLNLN